MQTPPHTPSTTEFLRLILPREGLKCAFVLENGTRKHHFYPTAEALAQALLVFDQSTSDPKGAVYHGCASYQPGGRRTKSAVASVQSLWLDIDVGPEREKYPTLPEALHAVEGFVRSTLLPVPLLVSSGGGLHCYWPLDRPLTREQWEPLALGLKALCEAHGLKAGPERTADVASILRPPGTTHRKDTPRPVVCGPLQGPYPVETFEEICHVRPGEAAKNSPLVHVPAVPRGPVPLHSGARARLLSRLANTDAPEAVNYTALAEGCAQMRAFKESHGNIPEPLWYAGIKVLAFCGGGDAVAHEWSAGHPTYSPAETDTRLRRSRELSGPTTCAYFRSLNPAGCNGCAFGTTTPIEAARRPFEPVGMERAPLPDVECQPVPADGPPPDGYALPGSRDYVIREGALYSVHEMPARNGETREVETKLTSYAVCVASVHAGEIRRDLNYYLLRHFKPHEGWREVDLPASRVFGMTAGGALADAGIVVHDLDGFKRFIRDSVDYLHKKEKTRMQFEQFGWKDGNTRFLYGDRLYAPGLQETTACSGELRYRAQWLKPVPGGSVAGWKQAVDCLMGKGSEGMSFAVLASFAAPLMRFMEDNEGGAIISLHTRHSGAGKTTSLAGAYTVWAPVDRALGLTTIDTKVSKGVTLGALCNLPVVYDEFSNKDPDVVREFVVMFTSGRDKMRADSSGQIIHTAASWQTLLLTAANQSLVDTINSTGESEAPSFRVLEFPVESTGDLSLSEAARLKKQMEENAGWAGDAYLSYIVQPQVLEWVKAKLAEISSEIFVKGGFRKEHRFWVRTLAAVATAAIIVEKLGLVSFSPARIIGWAVKHFSDKGRTNQADKGSLIPVLSRFLNEFIGETLTMPGPARGRQVILPIGDRPRTRVTIRVEVVGDSIYITDLVFREWLSRRGGGYSELMIELLRRGILRNERRLLTLTAGTDMRGGQVTCFEIDGRHPALTGELREVVGEMPHDRAAAVINRESMLEKRNRI